MNFNISNSMNFAPIMTFKNENKLTQGQIWCLSTIFLKNSHFNSFETVCVSLLNAMENSPKYTKQSNTHR